ncbi:MAG TPA: phage Gp37/Gp68 family protein [Verrucomicrobiae bacterium]
MKNSRIEWTDHTWNGWRGCTKVSPGCAHCYAEALSLRTGHSAYKKGIPRERLSEANWRKPIQWNSVAEDFAECTGCGGRGFQSTWIEDIRKTHPTALSCCPEIKLIPARQRVFCSSLSDWLDREVPIEWLADKLRLIEATPNLDYLLLTKRPENFFERVGECAEKWAVSCEIAVWWAQRGVPPSNVWVGTTIENNELLRRHYDLMKIPASVHFWSCEPLLSSLPDASLVWSTPLGAPNWVICGGESGPKARPMHPDWARSLRDQCNDAGIPFFFKQWGEWIPWEWDEQRFNDVIYSQHGKELWHDEAPRDLLNLPKGWSEIDISYDCTLVQRVGKKTAGRRLDGRDHSEFPKS